MTGALLNAPLDLRIVRPDGQVRWVRLYYELKRDVRGRARRSVGLMLDIDERKRQELALIEAEKAAQAGARGQVALPGLGQPRDPHPDERRAGRAAPAQGREACPTTAAS